MSESVTHNLSKPELECIEYCTALETISFNQVEFNTVTTTTEVDNETVKCISTTTSSPNLYYYTGTIKVLIPKLMPQYSVDTPTKIYANVDKSILLNDTSTQPTSLKGGVTIKNYMEANIEIGLTTKSGIKYGDTLTCIFPNKSIVNNPIINCL